MTTQRALAALVVIVGVVAIGAAAAGVDDTTQQSGASDSIGDGPGDGPGRSGDGLDRGAEPGATVGLPGWVFEWYFILGLGVFSLIGLAGAVYYVWTDRIDALRALVAHSLATIVGTVLFFAFVAVLLWAAFDWSTFEGLPEFVPPDPGGGAEQETRPENSTGIPPLVLAGVLVVMVVLVAILIVRLRGEEDDSPDEASEAIEADQPVSEAPAGVVPATELVEKNPDNPVYRAWTDLATRTGLAHERNRTPGEVAQAAIEQGFPREPVSTLTNVFSEVRYGHRPVTDERERRAESALQSIEGTGGDA